jgi:TrmH family RNA methyltransferase
MLVKSQVKYIQSLGHKKFRDADGAFVAEGPKIVPELLRSENLQLILCYASENWLKINSGIEKGRENLFVVVDEEELKRISFHSNPNQVLAIFTKPVFVKQDFPDGVTLLLDTIQDPGNLGTIVRTADWFNVRQIVCAKDTVDVFNPKVVQSAMGSVARVELIYTNLSEFIKSKPEVPVFAASLEGEKLDEKIMVSNVMLLLGNESKGISRDLELLAVKRIRIPGNGNAESLNVAVATGIILSRIEIVNQKRSLLRGGVFE